jgi:hypothetical protein
LLELFDSFLIIFFFANFLQKKNPIYVPITILLLIFKKSLEIDQKTLITFQVDQFFTNYINFINLSVSFTFAFAQV